MNLNVLVDPKVGVIRNCQVIKNLFQDPPFFCVYAEPARTAPIFGLEGRNRGGACDLSLEKASIRAAGECIERYCSVFREDAAGIIASEKELREKKVRFISARDVHKFTDAQYDSSNFSFGRQVDNEKIAWVNGYRVVTGEEALLSASLVFVPYAFRKAEAFTHMPISSGLAAGPNASFCVTKGIFELIERDALMVVWKRSYMPARVLLRADDETEILSRALSYAHKIGAEWVFNILTLDIPVPVCSAMMINREGMPLTSFGVSAEYEPTKALEGAILEAMLSRFLLNRSREVLEYSLDGWSDFRTLRGHLLGYAINRSLAEYIVGRFGGSGGEVTLAQIKQEIGCHKSVARATEEAGYEIFASDLTTEDIVAFGTRVVRVVIPGLEPLDHDHEHRHLGGDRLQSPPSLRFGVSDSTGTLCDVPHPFP